MLLTTLQASKLQLFVSIPSLRYMCVCVCMVVWLYDCMVRMAAGYNGVLCAKSDDNDRDQRRKGRPHTRYAARITMWEQTGEHLERASFAALNRQCICLQCKSRHIYNKKNMKMQIQILAFNLKLIFKDWYNSYSSCTMSEKRLLQALVMHIGLTMVII